MSVAVVTTVGVIAAALVPFVIFLIRRADKRKDPIVRSSAEVAIAKEALGILQVSRDTLEADVRRLIAAREVDRNARAADRERIDSLEVEVRSIRDGWGRWYADLTERWSHHRKQARPPSPPDLS